MDKRADIPSFEAIAQSIGAHRSELFGLAILSIMIFHFHGLDAWAIQGGALGAIAKVYGFFISSIGVDVFLFLSGMGLFYSMNRDSNAAAFWKRRLTRILPTYVVCAGIGWFIRDCILAPKGLTGFFWDFSMLSFWVDGDRGVWFIALILVLYLLFPPLWRLISQPHCQRTRLYVTLLLAVYSTLLVLMSIFSPDFYSKIEIALWRVPVFVLGAWYGCLICNGESPTMDIAMLCLFGIMLKLGTHIFTDTSTAIGYFFSLRATRTLFAVPLIVIAVYLFELLPTTALSRFLSWTGSLSLELYLCHVFLRDIFYSVGLDTTSVLVHAAIIALSFGLAVAFKTAIDRIFSRAAAK